MIKQKSTNFAQSIMEEINAPDFREKSKKIVSGWAVEQKYREKHAIKVRNIIQDMSIPEFLAFVSKVCDKECRIKSLLFTALLDAVFHPSNERPIPTRLKQSEMLSEFYIYKGISFRVYCDNGIKHKISMRKRLLFKSK